MADTEVPAGASAFDNGAGPEAGKAIGKVSVNSQAAIDSSAFKELNKEFKALSGHVTKFKQDLPALIADTKKWATELGKVAKQMKAIGEAKGGGGSSYMPDAGSITGGGPSTQVASGNSPTIQKIVNIHEAPGGGGGGEASPPNMKGAVWDAIKNLAGSAINAFDARAARGAQYSLSADKMNMLYQQTTGLSQNQVYHQYREPLQQYKLGMGGINTLLGLQARTGLIASKQAGSVEAMRAASGYAYSTEQIAGMTESLATPQANNQMFMMLGTGMYGIGGAQKTQQQVFQDIIKRTGLTNEKMLQGAFQQGSMTRARLSMAGLAEDQQDLLLQVAQQNIAFKKKGGQGFYDQSNKAHRELMGVEGNYANQAEETERVQAKREENFYKRQNDNFATFEKATQSATKALEMFEEKLSGIAGAGISTKKHRDVFGTAFKWGKKIAGVGMMAAGAGLTPFSGGTSLTMFAAGAGLYASGGDPIDGLMRRRRGGVWGVRTNNELGGDATTEGEPTEAKLSANNKNKLAQLDPKLREPLKKMLLANPKLEIGDARRSGARQEASFRRRYSKAPAGVTKKTKDADRIWNGEVWIYDKHAENGPPMAAPGQSMHEIGLAADLSQSENEWIRANAASFGLSHGGTQKGLQTDEPFHVQPAGIPFGRAEYEGQSGTSSSPTGTSVTSGIADGPTTAYSTGGEMTTGGSRGSASVSATSAGLPSSYTFQYAGMSMGEIIGSGSVYAKGTTPTKANPSSSYPSASAGGDPTPSSPLVAPAVQSGNSFNITISPNLTIQSTGELQTDIRRVAKDVADLLEKEVKLKMMRIS